jgi:hypothetical protein
MARFAGTLDARRSSGIHRVGLYERANTGSSELGVIGWIAQLSTV